MKKEMIGAVMSGLFMASLSGLSLVNPEEISQSTETMCVNASVATSKDINKMTIIETRAKQTATITKKVVEATPEETTMITKIVETEALETTTEVKTETEETTTVTTESVITTQVPDETTTVEWYLSDYNGFAVAKDKEGNTLDRIPDCEPAGILTEVESVDDSTLSQEHNQEYDIEVPEYGSDEFLLAYAMSREAKYGDYTDATYVANVIINRKEDPDFPNSILDVLQQPRQYPWGVSYYSRDYIYDSYFYEIARNLLNGDRPLPENVVYQAQFVQGSGIYCKWGVHYYCYK